MQGGFKRTDLNDTQADSTTRGLAFLGDVERLAASD